jgi:hypothetical protein
MENEKGDWKRNAGNGNCNTDEGVLPNPLMLWVGDNQSLVGCGLPGDLVL